MPTSLSYIMCQKNERENERGGNEGKETKEKQGYIDNTNGWQ